MIDTSIQRVEINQVIENRLPEFVQSESPLCRFHETILYLPRVSGWIIIENLDRYTKLQTYVGAALTEYTGLSTDTESYSSTIFVDSTKGYPSKYGLLKIDDEILHTSKTHNFFHRMFVVLVVLTHGSTHKTRPIII